MPKSIDFQVIPKFCPICNSKIIRSRFGDKACSLIDNNTRYKNHLFIGTDKNNVNYINFYIYSQHHLLVVNKDSIELMELKNDNIILILDTNKFEFKNSVEETINVYLKMRMFA